MNDHELQLIMLSASANKLSKLKEQAEEYASLIMEELDPENFGYIEVKITAFEFLIIMSMMQTLSLLLTSPLISYGNWKHCFYKETYI